ncbi:MAG: hypothetical protein ACRDJM_11220 [Actinomycetota bacterium]
MRKTLVMSVVALTAALAMALTPARAEVTVTIDQEEGATVFSLPPLPEGVEYPAEIPTKLTGTATFNSPGGSVTVLVGRPNPVAREATLDCDEAGTTCSWSASLPFLVTPGETEIFVAAADADETIVYAPCDPGIEGCAGHAIMVI